MKENILVVGTVAYDILFPIQGDIRKEIPLKNGKLRSVNMSFLARKSQYYFGGTAANIAYGLGLLGKKPYMYSAVGSDFNEEFKNHLEKHGVHCSPIVGPKGSETAKCFQISDELHQQITIFQANYYGDRIEDMALIESLSRESLINMKYAIFSPGNNVSTLNHILEFRKFNEEATIIFDPGMNVTSFTKEDISECASLSDILISNDVEILRIEKIHGLSIKDILNIGINYVIETQGEKGSTIHSVEGITHIPIIKPRHVVETTGAGDAYRAGLIAGLADGNNIKEACHIGAKMGALCVEEYGGQGYQVN